MIPFTYLILVALLAVATAQPAAIFVEDSPLTAVDEPPSVPDVVGDPGFADLNDPEASLTNTGNEGSDSRSGIVLDSSSDSFSFYAVDAADYSLAIGIDPVSTRDPTDSRAPSGPGTTPQPGFELEGVIVDTPSGPSTTDLTPAPVASQLMQPPIPQLDRESLCDTNMLSEGQYRIVPRHDESLALSVQGDSIVIRAKRTTGTDQITTLQTAHRERQLRRAILET